MKATLRLLTAMSVSFVAAQAIEPADTDNDGIPNTWETSMGLSPTNPADANSDSDGDDLTAFMEYSIGGSPTTHDTGLLPNLVLVKVGGATYAQVSFHRRYDNSALIIVPEFATGLGQGTAWSADNLTLLQAPQRVAGGLEVVTYRTTAPIGAQDRRFLRARLNVSRRLFSSGLGSVSQITTPSLGVGGTTTLNQGSFSPAVQGDGANLVNTGDMIQFPVSGGGAGSNLNLLRGEIEFWFRSDVDADADTTTRALFVLGDYAAPPNLVLAESNRLSLTLTTATRSESVSSPINAPLWRANEWVHIRATWDTASTQDSLQIFVNGVRIDEGGAEGDWSLGGASPPTHFYLGSANATGAFPGGGTFDSVIVRDRRQAWEGTNSAPFLTPLTAHWPTEGELVSFTAAATDPDNHNLTWSLDPGAPPGATINSTNGAFSYTPPPGTAPAFYDFYIRVTDDGTPNMSDTARLTIGVVGSNPPVLSNLTPASQQSPPTGTPSVTFDWADQDHDITAVRLTTTNALGSHSEDIPAFSLQIKGPSGQAALNPNPADLPYGLTTFSARLLDSRGNLSTAQNFQLTVTGTGSGSTAPIINSFAAESFYVIKPTGSLDVAYPSLLLTVSDADQDAQRLRITTTLPDTTSETVEISLAQLKQDLSGPQWTARLNPYKIRSTSPFGIYNFDVVVIDSNGNASAGASTSISLAFPFLGAQRTPIIDSIFPTSGDWGDEVTLQGVFPEMTDETVTVELGGQECEVTFHSLSSLTFIIPEGAYSGTIIVRTSRGAKTCSSAIYPVNPRVEIFPLNRPHSTLEGDSIIGEEAPVVFEGSDYPFFAKSSLPDVDGGTVTWYVNNIPGGSLAVGTIGDTGVYHAPDVVNANLSVEITAKLDADPDISDSMEIIVAPKAIPPGGGPVRAAAGAMITSYDGRSSLDIPQNGLTSNTTIGIATLANMQLPAPRPGRRVQGGVTLSPSGLLFQSPAQLTLPLARSLPPDSTIPVLFYNTTTSQYVDEGIVGTVAEDGASVTCQITHFSTYIADEPASSSDGPAAPPTLTTSLPVPSGGFEGAQVPIRFTGTNLGPDLEVQVFNESAQPVPDISTGPFYASPDGTTGGCTLFIGALPNLDEGEGHIYTIRLVRPGFGHADASFSVAGLDEFILGPSSVINLNNEPPRTYSSVNIPAGALVRVIAGRMDFTATGPIIVNGTIDASGRDGYHGDERTAGAMGFQGGAGGYGQDEGPGSFFLLPGVEWDEATAINQGKDGNAVHDNVHKPAGYGGAAGTSVELDIGGLITKLVAAVGTGGLAIIEAAREIISVANAISDLSESSPMGRRGLGASPFAGVGQDATGGGGGGGGGLFQIGLTFFGNGVTFSVDGGGGGGGGDGGRSISLRSASAIAVNGLIDTHGGHGGDGSTTSSFRVVPEIFGIDLPEISVGGGSPCYPGGGGGGGRGGRIHLIGNGGVYAAHGSLVHYGGNGGQTGFVMIDPALDEMKLGMHRNWLSDGPALGVENSGPVFDPAHYQTKATNRRVLRMEGLRSVYVSGFGGTASMLLNFPVAISYATAPVTAPFDIDDYPEIAYDDSLGRYDGAILLHEGWNTLTTNLDQPITILVISTDSDNDGLSDADETDYGTNPNDSDSDNDGLSDGAEIVYRTDPLVPDSDYDGIPDGDEINNEGTDPRKFDTDDDGFSDGAELALGTNPFLDHSKPDSIPPNTLLVMVQSPDGARLGIMDPINGRIAMMGKPADGFGFGMACSPLGDIYVLSGSRLLIYNAITDVQTEIGTLSGGILGGPLAYDPATGMLYTIQLTGGPNPQSTGQLVRIDPNTAATTLIGPPLASPMHSLACTWDGKLFACRHNASGGDDLIELNPATGAVLQTLGQSGKTPLRGLTFSRDQNLYAAQPIGTASGDLWSLNAATAAPTTVFSTSLPIYDLTVAPLPPPGLQEITSFDWDGALIPHIEIGNFNGDAYPDLVKVQDDYPEVRIQFLMGSATGDFTATGGTRLPSDANLNRPFTLATEDLNADGIADVVVPSSGEVGKTVLLLSQKSSGVYVDHIQSTITHTGTAFYVSVGSMNSSVDSFPDIIISTDTSLQVKYNNGTATSFTTTSLSAAEAITIGDLNHDNFPDIVRSGAIHFNNGDGTFDPPAPIATGNAYRIGDFNGDTHPDLSFTGNDTLGISLGDGTGAFGTPTYKPGNFAGSLDAGIVHDFDGDGLDDVLAGNFETGFSAYFRLAEPTSRIVPLPFLLGTSALWVGNALDTLEPEVVAANRYADTIYIYKIAHPFKE